MFFITEEAKEIILDFLQRRVKMKVLRIYFTLIFYFIYLFFLLYFNISLEWLIIAI